MEIGCTLFSKLNRVKVHRMRWLGNVSVDKEYCSMVVYLEGKEEVDKLFARMTVATANGECAFTHPFAIVVNLCGAIAATSAHTNLSQTCNVIKPRSSILLSEHTLQSHLRWVASRGSAANAYQFSSYPS